MITTDRFIYTITDTSEDRVEFTVNISVNTEETGAAMQRLSAIRSAFSDAPATGLQTPRTSGSLASITAGLFVSRSQQRHFITMIERHEEQQRVAQLEDWNLLMADQKPCTAADFNLALRATRNQPVPKKPRKDRPFYRLGRY